LKTPRSVCPECGYCLEGALAIDQSGEPPRPGDLSVCAKCTSFLTFDEAMKLHLVTVGEIQDWTIEIRRSMLSARDLLKDFNKNSPTGGFGSSV